MIFRYKRKSYNPTTTITKMSSKTFTKNKLVFNIPDGIDFKDKSMVKEVFVRRDRLFIIYADDTVSMAIEPNSEETFKKKLEKKSTPRAKKTKPNQTFEEQVQQGKAKARKAVEDAKAICPPAIEEETENLPKCVACGSVDGCLEYTWTGKHHSKATGFACKDCAEEAGLETEEEKEKNNRIWWRNHWRERMGRELSDEEFERFYEKRHPLRD